MDDQSFECKVCGYSLDINVEYGEMIFSCENCGACELVKNPFDFTLWYVIVRQALAPIDIIESLFVDRNVVSFLRTRLKGVSHLGDFKEAVGFDASDDYLWEHLIEAHQVYRRQTIVLAMTYVESIIRDFYRCYLNADVNRVYDYLVPGSQRREDKKKQAQVSLSEVLETSRDEFIELLVERALGNAVKSNDKAIVVLEDLVTKRGIKLDRSTFFDDLRELNDQRNRIVHGRSPDEEISIEQVHSSFGLILYLLYVLSCVASRYRVPYLDEASVLFELGEKAKGN